MKNSWNKENVLSKIFPLIVTVLCWYQIEISAGYDGFSQCLQMEWKYICLNMFTGAVLWMIFYLITNRLWLSGLFFSLITFIISIINYYTIKLSGRPLSIMEIKNAKTALNVIQAYKIEMDKFSIVIIAIFLVCSFICIEIKKNETIKISMKQRVFRNIVLCFCGIIFLYVGYFAANPIKPQKTVGWSWVEAYHKYGYMACSLEMICQTRNIIEVPNGYSNDKVERIVVADTGDKRNQTPDVILILNESFYDLSKITDLEMDIPYMNNINNLENCIKGYTIVPSAGGGTNNSEYELLTSNSLQLMKGITPFNVLDMSEANSIVSHLNSLGYDTTGAHSEPALNYSRGRAYSDMGFKHIYFDTDFEKKEYYEDRWFESDESLYKNLISWYEDDLKEQPKFMYLLTIQNHGGWDLNEKECDLVHALRDYGEYDEQVDEFLTCIYQSDIAFKRFIEYLETVDRPVIVCMVGDHSPTFAEKIIDEKYTAEERRLLLRSTPFVIWANYDIEEENVGNISMNYLIPKLLEVSGMPKSPYYDYMIDLQKKIPVLTSYDIYIDSNGNEYRYSDVTEYSEIINNYFYLEYNNLQKDRNQQFFDAYLN